MDTVKAPVMKAGMENASESGFEANIHYVHYIYSSLYTIHTVTYNDKSVKAVTCKSSTSSCGQELNRSSGMYLLCHMVLCGFQETKWYPWNQC